MKKLLNSVLKNHKIFLGILVLAAILRFYRVSEMALFNFDQEYAANFAYSVVKEFPIQLIGQGLSVQGLFMGPLYFYYLVPFFLLFKLHPIGGIVGSIMLGLGTISAYYYLGNKVFNKHTALIIAFLRAILFFKLNDDWIMVPAYSCELLVIITWYYFFKYWRGDVSSLPILGLVFGLYTSFHPILFPFYLVFLLILLLKRKLPSFKKVLLSILLFVVPCAPLILFEYLHNFMEVKRLIELFSNRSDSIVFSFAKLLSFIDPVLRGLYVIFGFGKTTSLLVVYAFSLGVFVFCLIFTLQKKSFWKENFHLIFLSISVLSFILYYYFFPVKIVSYYLNAPITLFFIYFGALLGYFYSLPKIKWFVFLFLLIVFLTNLNLLRGKWANPGLDTLAHKDNIVKKIISDLGGEKNFTVSYINLPGWDFGFEYIFKSYDYTPKDRIRDKVGYNYTIVVPKELSLDSLNYYSGNIGLIFPDR